MSVFDWFVVCLFFVLFLFFLLEEGNVVISSVKSKPNLIVDFSTSVLACPVPLP